MDHALVLFDGVCNLCSRTVQTLIRWDKRARFRFASLQSPTGGAICGTLKARYGRIPDTIVLVQDGHLYIKSEAILRMARLLGGLWYGLLVFWILPRRWRDAVYDAVARRRYRWFGRQATCWLPSPALKDRFLPDDPTPATAPPNYL